MDDQKFVRNALRSLFSEHPQWEIYEAESGKIALERIHRIRPHVVVLDLMMPEMNGLELACKIRQLDHSPRIVLISTHYTPEEATILARLFGDGGFIQKSEAGRKLIPVVRSMLAYSAKQ